ncbi:DUF418 domain-containing protein [Actinotalea fermentans]|uniref:Heparan-alpha-glucosaminide N-acetyltransferase catalytic domain-containing protein n=1 Tax=Actinotalea fermentans TaxID=43671 RepID=A0A511YTD7_9CELL|nr:DUF418 domain-containing protein [Actinotalea fermentans]KGM17345.1 hypothetical protein N867_05180 [Actinotalea fermentans ATCC 43279 = JCM 9966 = DSM 3133]GEN78455.1 hypothetical protein AFE02nite_01890 [Actinotalea fermentans]
MSSSRIVGVDVARGLAVLGMVVAHVGEDDAARLPNGSSWLEAFDGRSAAGFALLAGVSAALLSADATRLGYARVRILVRAALLLPLGLVLDALGTPVVIILPAYAVMFAMLTAALAWRPRTLLVAAAVVALAAPPLAAWLRDGAGASAGPLAILWQRYYPPMIWIAYLLVGLAVGRVLRLPTTPRTLVTWGVGAAVLGLATNAVAMRTIDESHTLQRALLTSAPHTSSPVELLANTGVVLVVLGLCLVAGERWPRALGPLAATGALALTAYTGQVVAIAILGRGVVFDPDVAVAAAFVLVTVAACTLWRATVGRGPLERALHAASTATADAVMPAR